jgi:hypothetical protein
MVAVSALCLRQHMRKRTDNMHAARDVRAAHSCGPKACRSHGL